MALLAYNPTDRVDQLIGVTERLTDILHQETELLKTSRPRALAPLRDEKNRLANAYMREVAAVKGNPNLLEGADSEVVDNLKAAILTFNHTLGEHEKLLSRNRTLSERFIKSIADDVMARKAPRTSYGANAIHVQPVKNRPASLALNRVV